MRVLRFQKSGPSVKMSFGFRTFLGLKWAKKRLFKENRKQRREWKLGATASAGLINGGCTHSTYFPIVTVSHVTPT